jgi:hypothetical protein
MQSGKSARSRRGRDPVLAEPGGRLAKPSRRALSRPALGPRKATVPAFTALLLRPPSPLLPPLSSLLSTLSSLRSPPCISSLHLLLAFSSLHSPPSTLLLHSPPSTLIPIEPEETVVCCHVHFQSSDCYETITCVSCSEPANADACMSYSCNHTCNL